MTLKNRVSPWFVNVSQVKKYVKENGKRTTKELLNYLNNACQKKVDSFLEIQKISKPESEVTDGNDAETTG